jgi:peptide/nickel transport system permease protein
VSTAQSADAAVISRGAPPRTQALRRFLHAYVRNRGGMVGVVVLVAFTLMALTAPLWISSDDLSAAAATGPLLAPPSSGYPLGTDQPGRSVLLLLIYGSRPSLAIGVIATLATVVIGAAIGLLAGHYQGVTGNILMRVTDWFIALPGLPLAISLSVVLGQGPVSITVAIAVTSWTAAARLVRAQTLAVEARPFVERARALGAGNTQIMLRHVLPNVMPLILVSSTLTVASAILSETTLTFLGLGDPTDISWGSMINQAFTQGAITAGAWWYVLPPGLAIVVVVLGFTLVGRAVEAILNPRMVNR